MKITSQEQMLDLAVREKILLDIIGSAGVKARKLEHEKREEVYKDRGREYVLRLIRREMGTDSVLEMINRSPNINITRKIVRKKARVYKDRPKRTVELVKARPAADPEGTAAPKADAANPQQDQLDAYVDALGLDAFMKETNRAVELHRNILAQVLPHRNMAELKAGSGQPLYDIDLKILRPNRFDVVEDPDNPKEPLIVILSYYDEGGGILQDYRAARVEESTVAQNENARTESKVMPSADGQKRLFVWWSSKYHFTTDDKGEIVNVPGATPEDGKNPFGVLPFISFAKEQVDGFWSDGGEGLADNSILINLLLADLNYAAKFQGTGLGWMSGKKVPEKVMIGPANFIRMEYSEGEPEPKIGFENADAKLSDMLNVIREQLGYYLTSEDLEPGSITGELTPATANSGVQEMIQKAEPINAVEDEQQLYKDKEPLLMKTVMTVAKVYQDLGLLCAELSDAGTIKDPFDYDLIFIPPQVALTEGERVQVIVNKQKTGLFTRKQLLKELNPDLDDAAIEVLMKDLDAEKKANTPPDLLPPANGLPPAPNPAYPKEPTKPAPNT